MFVCFTTFVCYAMYYMFCLGDFRLCYRVVVLVLVVHCCICE